MSENSYQDEAKIAKLPKEGVHCFPANAKQISTRRIVTITLAVIFAALAVYFFVKPGPSLPLGGISAVVAVISVIVFVQTFLIANYRVAVDYNNKEVILRYKFSKIAIPFENFDARDGEPDKAEELIDANLGGSEKTYYLVLDNVFDEACFQTSTKDLASREDFFKLKEETFAIADAYGARNDENAIKPDSMKTADESKSAQDSLNEDVIDSIVDEAKNEMDKEKEEHLEEAAKKAEEAVQAAEEAAKDAEEKSEEADS